MRREPCLESEFRLDYGGGIDRMYLFGLELNAVYANSGHLLARPEQVALINPLQEYCVDGRCVVVEVPVSLFSEEFSVRFVGASSFTIFGLPTDTDPRGMLAWDPSLLLLDWTVRWVDGANDETALRSVVSAAVWFTETGCNVEATWWAVLPATTEALQLEPEPELRRLCVWPRIDGAERERSSILLEGCDGLWESGDFAAFRVHCREIRHLNPRMRNRWLELGG